MAVFLRGDVWWYEFWFAGRRVRESTKSPSKTLAKTSEQTRKRELEQGFNNVTDTRQERIRTISDLADEYLVAYKLRHPQSATFATYAVGHISRVNGGRMFIDCNEAVVTSYQNERLGSGAAPKTVNDEVGFLLRLMGDPGDLLRIRLRKRNLLKLKVGKPIGNGIQHGRKRPNADRSEEVSFAPHLPGNHAGAKRWYPRCGTKAAHLGADRPQEGLPDGRQEQDGGWRRENHPAELGTLRDAS